MPACRDVVAFVFQGAAVSVEEVLCAAHFRGELAASAKRLAARVACEAEADRLKLEPDREAVEARVERFRYDRDLISGEETEAWLGVRGLTPTEMEAHLTRELWGEALAAKVAAVDVAPPVTAGLLDALAADLLFDGGFGALAGALSRRLMTATGAARPPDDGPCAAERQRFFARAGLDPAGLSGWLAALGREAAWFERKVHEEVAYQAVCASLLTPGRQAGELAVLRLPLTRLNLECIEFDTLDAAREGHLCVREDGLTLEQVAEGARYPFRRLSLLAEQAPEEQRQRLLCASVGEVLAPVAVGEVVHLLRLEGKVEPTLGDPAVRARVEQRILDAHFTEAAAGELRWLVI